ncbi:MAG TPA: transglycosylase domain-containing protein, partial [Alphaproteobacteria bacterium]|nr:transglycosylase domain-containing protein [Alphaproteobacteria bacterium]
MLYKVLKLLTGFFLIILSGISFAFYLLFYYGRDLPDYSYLKTYHPVVLTQFVNETGPWRDSYEQRRIYSALDKMPPLLVQAFLTAEDKNFYYHFGVDILGTFKAAFLNTIYNRWKSNPLGASTITQQVSKNFLVGNERSFIRKIKEAIMAIRLEHALSKDKILELYLNEIFLGRNSYGVAVAAMTYFNKDLKGLTIEEMAFLASLPKAPSFYSKDFEQKGKKRRNWILKKMAKLGIISTKEAKKACKNPLILKQAEKVTNLGSYAFEDMKRQLDTLFSKKRQNQGLIVETTLDFTLQHLSEDALKKGLELYDKRHEYQGPIHHVEDISTTEKLLEGLNTLLPSYTPKSCVLAVVTKVTKTETLFLTAGATQATLSQSQLDKTYAKGINLSPGDVVWLKKNEEGFEIFQVPKVGGAIVVLNKNTGHVLALSGGYDFALNQYNGATQALRQPGSAYKTLIYVSALENGYTPESVVSDDPLTFSLGRGLGTYSPRNFDRKFYGPTQLYIGLAKSRNVMTVRLAHALGMAKIAELTKRLGVMEKVPAQLSIALGAGSTTLLKLSLAYGCF